MAETFVNFKQTVITADCYQRVKIRRVSWARNISYFISNQISNPALVRILISPDGKAWIDDGVEVEVPPKETVILVPNYISKFCTLEYKSKCSSHPAKLSIWFQMTRPPARGCYGVGNDWS